MIRPVEVKALEPFKIWIRFSDQTKGSVDLSYLADYGVFKAWDNKSFFESVRISESGAIAWGDDIELCPDALYVRVSGKLSPRAHGLTIEWAQKYQSELLEAWSKACRMKPPGKIDPLE